ncbi:2,3-diaminopropionate biosynthesis protein SbnA [Paenibacillus oenotherae]|uniref:N-(2-amino-2-carboxyethyl)-L-glutamate synthase n=1 Tax=Paenibacillus oenotherae TaxID=1435645 RepID=A0ABS7D1I9_9BACL|nr:2,3-diaminopropionate biosynthesis protein SbnA [Paenibacillus oenotherae]MBW7473810.1 2,3-diaminopropionate biosynthesis protein SbnA [Paenibacillus oenotherae]
MVNQVILDKVGNTPVVQLSPSELNHIHLYAKMESFNPTGSVKDRAASYIIQTLLNSGEINKETVIMESSSGNFGVALSSYCRYFGLPFYCIVDPNIASENEMLIQRLSTKMIKVTTPDSSGGYLLTRIEKVKELKREIANSYWINQYGNPLNASAYYHTLATELCGQFDQIDYLFMGVSSGGTISGTSRKVKEMFPNCKVIAVDMVGSVIFGGAPQKRHIPGIGSSMTPDILKTAVIDEVMMVDEASTIRSCHELLDKEMIYAGGSSGSVYSAVKQYFAGKTITGNPNVVMIFADRGERYGNTIYNPSWYTPFLEPKKTLELI